MKLRTGSFPAQDWLLDIQSPQTSYYEGAGCRAAWPWIPGNAHVAFKHILRCRLSQSSTDPSLLSFHPAIVHL